MEVAFKNLAFGFVAFTRYPLAFYELKLREARFDALLGSGQ